MQKTPWQLLFSTISPPYTEYGKVFNSMGVSEFEHLNSSGVEIKGLTQVFYLQEYGFHKVNSPFVTTSEKDKFGGVSVANKEIVELDVEGYLYAQVQQRREGEFSKQSGERIDRSFIQARFVYLTRDVIEKVYKAQLALYSSLLYDKQNNNGEMHSSQWKLNDYVEMNERQPQDWQVVLSPLRFGEYTDTVRGIVKAFLISSRPLDSVEKFIRRPEQIVVVKPGLSILEKLIIVDLVQFYLYPIMDVISFSLDYITDRDLVLRLYDQPGGLKDFYSDQDLMNINVTGNLSDYVDLMFQLDANILYHPDFQRLLKAGNTTLQAVNKLRLKIKKYRSEEVREWIKHVMTIVDDGKDDLVDMDFIYDELRDGDIFQIIRHNETPADLVLSLLKYLEMKMKHGLLEYFQFHLAIPATVRLNQAFEDQVVHSLQRMVRRSDQSVLDQIPQTLQEQIYMELLLHARNVSFSTGQSGEEKVLLSLLQRPSARLFKVIKSLASEDLSSLMLDIIREFNSTSVVWEASQIYSFWGLLELHTYDLFVIFLHMLVSSEKNQKVLIDNPSSFQTFLVSGRVLLVHARHGAAGVIDGANDGSLSEETLLSNINPYIAKELREICIKIADSKKAENMKFSEWWLLAELGYTEILVFQEDFYQIQKLNAFIGIESKKILAFEYRYLISLGKISPQTPLKDICKNCNGNTGDLLNSTNMLLFNSIVNIWIDNGISLMLEDLVLLIHQLPQSNKILSKIVLGEQQKHIVLDLDATNALLWLAGTFGELRREYQHNGGDFLCSHLININKPNSALIWQILVEEEAVYPLDFEWDEYVKICQQVEGRLPKYDLDSFGKLKTYFDIVGKSTSYPKKHQINKKLIKFFVTYIFYGYELGVESLTDSELESLYYYSGYGSQGVEIYKVVAPARRMLINYFSNSNFPDSWEHLSHETQSLLKLFVYAEHKYIPETTFQIISNWDKASLLASAEDSDVQTGLNPLRKKQDADGLSYGEQSEKTGNEWDNSDIETATNSFGDLVRGVGLVFFALLVVASVILIALIILKVTGTFDFIAWFYGVSLP